MFNIKANFIMKAIKFRFFCFLLATAAILNFTSCDKDDDDDTATITIDFEDVTLNPDGYWNGSDLSGTPVSEESWGEITTNYYGSFKSGIAAFNNKYTEEWYSWSGFACSSLTDKTNPELSNQYSVYADGGASGSQKFAIAFVDGTSDFQFQTGVEKTIHSVMVNNSTYTYYVLKDGNPFSTAFTAGDWFKVIFTGYNAQGNITGTKDFYLADFQSGKSYICSEWTKVDLSALGKINRIEISMSSSDTYMDYMNTPAYVCLDNLIYVK